MRAGEGVAIQCPPPRSQPRLLHHIFSLSFFLLNAPKKQPAYVFGTDPSDCDVCIPPLPGSQRGGGGGGFHAAALVHHSDGRTFLISLSPLVAVSLDGGAAAGVLPLNKPTALRKGSSFSFGGKGGVAVASFTFECEEGGGGGGGGSSGGTGSAARASASPSSVRASHLLVKHAGSRRPSSWKEPVVTRSLEEARAMVSAFRERIGASAAAASSSPADAAAALAAAFASLAAPESHCSSARNGGDLGVFSRGQMQRAFEDAAFSLGVGEMSGLVESDSGETKGGGGGRGWGWEKARASFFFFFHLLFFVSLFFPFPSLSCFRPDHRATLSQPLPT